MKKPLIWMGVLGALAAVITLMLPTFLQMAGLHPHFEGEPIDLAGKRALIITTSHATLNVPGETGGEATGVAASEMTQPYYEFLDAGMQVDLASVKGGPIPIDPSTLGWPLRSWADDRYLEDAEFQRKVATSRAIADIDPESYDVIFLSGGWGAAYDFATSKTLAEVLSAAYAADHKPILSGVCHGPLGFVEAVDPEGNRLVAGRAMTGVTDKQVDELGIHFTPFHPETELRKAGALFESETAFMDILANHVVVDAEERFVTGQNQNAGAETAHKAMQILVRRAGGT